MNMPVAFPSPPAPRTLSGLEERAGERRPFRQLALSFIGRLRSSAGFSASEQEIRASYSENAEGAPPPHPLPLRRGGGGIPILFSLKKKGYPGSPRAPHAKEILL